MPRYAHWAARLAPIFNLANARPLRELRERLVGFSARRELPRWRADYFRATSARRPRPARSSGGPVAVKREVVLLVDTFSRWFEPENARAAVRVLDAAGYTGTLATNSELEFVRYLRPGDRLETEAVMESISPRKRTSLGLGYFVTWVNSYTTTEGELVGRQLFRIFKFDPSTIDPATFGGAS